MKRNLLIYLLVIGISLIIATRFPIGNDEAYYIAWAKNLQLSYVDAPPFVAYLNVIQAKLGLFQPLTNRILVVILHLLSTIFLMLIVKNNWLKSAGLAPNMENITGLSDKLLVTFLLAYIVPIFGLYGILILPDSGLILGLSLMLFTSDTIIRKEYISIKNILLLGIGLGIGMLSKYHILPLAGGMLLGLYLDLILVDRRANLMVLSKLILSLIIGLIIAMPVLIWNYLNHYASFIFQLQHGFSSNSWQITSMLEFILGTVLYLTPWFAYILSKYGLLWARRYYLLIPIISLGIILIASSLRKNILPHWLAPAFWLLIPYTVININNLKPLKLMCKYTSIIWLILLFILLLPGGMLNIKHVTKLFNPDTTGLADLLLWQELPGLFAKNTSLQHSLSWLRHTTPQNCQSPYPLIGTVRWYWASQLEYYQVFGLQYKILNLDLKSSNFYTWRDDLASFANCPILIVADIKSTNLPNLANVVTIQNSYIIHGVGDYKSLNLILIEGIFKNTQSISILQQNLLNHPHY